MPYLSNIVCKLNDGIKRSALKNGLIDGIAYQVVRKAMKATRYSRQFIAEATQNISGLMTANLLLFTIDF